MRCAPGLLVLPALLAGCLSLEPTYHRPPAPVPGEIANGAGPAVTEAPVPQPWRAFFGDPRLSQVIAEALVDNRDLRAAVANVAIARATYEQQRADLFPTVNASAGGTFGSIPAAVAAGGGAAGGHINEHVFTATVGVSAYELDLFGRVRSLSKAALEQYFASQEARRSAQIALVSQVAQAWLAVGADRSLQGAAADTLKAASASRELTQAKLDHGEASQSDVDQARTLEAQARFDVARYATQIRQDRDSLELLAGTPIGDDLLPGGIDDEAKVLGALPGGVSSAVLLDRPDVVQAEDQLKAANADIGAARAAFFPQITLTGSGGVTSTALSSLFSAASETWTFAPQVVQPIFDAGRNRAGLKLARGQRDLAQANYEKAIQTAFREVADALAQRGQIDEELAAQRALADSAADAARLADEEFRRGAASYLDVLTAQRTLYSAQQSLATTRLLQATNLVALYQALGGGL